METFIRVVVATVLTLASILICTHAGAQGSAQGPYKITCVSSEGASPSRFEATLNPDLPKTRLMALLIVDQSTPQSSVHSPTLKSNNISFYLDATMIDISGKVPDGRNFHFNAQPSAAGNAWAGVLKISGGKPIKLSCDLL